MNSDGFHIASPILGQGSCTEVWSDPDEGITQQIKLLEGPENFSRQALDICCNANEALQALQGQVDILNPS